MAALFVAIEGIDGSGKTTLLEGLTELFVRKRIKGLSFKEPGDDNPIGHAFRQMSKRRGRLPPLTAVFLLAAERHWRSKQISQWLKEGFIVLADRYYLSGLVYCKAEGISFEKFSAFHEGILKPQLYIWLRVPPKIALQRRGEIKDRWEEDILAQKIVRLYPEACKYVETKEDGEIFPIDATKNEFTVLKEAFSLISRRADLEDAESVLT